MKENVRDGISADALKLLAMLTMVIDHVGAVLFPRMLILRLIGRLAFPIYVWLLVEGFAHTSSRKRYMGRMAAFALLSEAPFDLALSGRLTLQWQNVYFSLFWSLVLLTALEWVADGGDGKGGGRFEGFRMYAGRHRVVSGALLLACFMILARLLRFDYGCTAPVLTALFYLYFRTGRPELLLGFFVFSFSNFCTPLIDGLQKGGAWPTGNPGVWERAWRTVWIECFGAPAVFLIRRCNGVRRWKKGKLLFYFFYPLHLLILYAVRAAIG